MKSILSFLVYSLALFSQRGLAGTFQLIDGSGRIQSSTQTKKFLEENGSGDESSHVCGILSCDFTKGPETVNRVFDTAFEKGLGMTLSASKESSQVDTFSAFQDILAASFCGSRATEYCCNTADSICIALPGDDLLETIDSFDQIIRRAIQRTQSTGAPVILLIDTTGLPTLATDDQKAAMTMDIRKRGKAIALDGRDEREGETAGDNVHAVYVNTGDPVSVAEAQGIIKSLTSKKYQPVSDTSLANKLTSEWAKVPAGSALQIYTPAQRMSLFAIEAAYAGAIAQIEAGIAHWQERVGQGKMVGKFGTRAKQLLASVMKTYSSKTAGTTTVRERANRAGQIKDTFQKLSMDLFSKQLGLQCIKANDNLQKSLVKMLVKAKEELTEEDMQQAMRNALFQYRAGAAELEVEELDLTVTSEMVGIASDTFQATVKAFPESNVAKLAELRKAEAISRKPPRRRKKRGLNIGWKGLNVALDLVGMLRPPGYGNLQGFLAYSAGLLGVPLNIMLGMQNDGDAPEVVGEDREYPILRLQPKVHFDLDFTQQ